MPSWGSHNEVLGEEGKKKEERGNVSCLVFDLWLFGAMFYFRARSEKEKEVKKGAEEDKGKQKFFDLPFFEVLVSYIYLALGFFCERSSAP